MAHSAVEALGPVPGPIARAYGHAWAGRLAEARNTVILPLPGPNPVSCEVTFIGVFHRDPANLRFVTEAIEGIHPDVIALEARPSLRLMYGSLEAALPLPLLRKLSKVPLQDLQETLTYVTLDDRLAWHSALVGANERLASSGSPASSTLSPPHLVSAFLARELALSDKIAAAGAAAEAGLPLHGLELEDPAAYSAFAAGPLTGPPLTEQQWAGQQGPGLHGQGEAADCDGGLSPEALEAEQRSIALSCLPPAVAAAFQRWFQRTSEAMEDSGDGDEDGGAEVLQAQLAALMTQCMDPEAYLSYVDRTDALMSDARRAGASAAAQYTQLTAVREAHFLERLQQLAATSARGRAFDGPAPEDGAGESAAEGGGLRRRVGIAVVLGRTHAARLRRALRAGAGKTDVVG